MLTYQNLRPEDATRFEDYILPYVRDLSQRANFWYFVALDEMQVAGMAVVDPTDEVATLLSVGIAPQYQRQGVATELVLYANMMLREAGIPRLSVTYTGGESQLAPIHDLFTKMGFEAKNEATGFFTTTLGAAAQGKELAKVLGRPAHKGVLLLSEATELEKRHLSKRLLEEGLYTDLDWSIVDPKISTFHRNSEGQIDAIFAMENREGKLVHNSYTYVAPEAKPSFLLLYLFAEAIRHGQTYFPPELPVTFACINQQSERLLRGIVPTLSQSLVQVEYEVGVDQIKDPKHIPNYENPDGFRPDRLTLEDLCCKDCIFATAEFSSCQLYTKKAGTVLYGGACDDYEKAPNNMK